MQAASILAERLNLLFRGSNAARGGVVVPAITNVSQARATFDSLDGGAEQIQSVVRRVTEFDVDFAPWNRQRAMDAQRGA